MKKFLFLLFTFSFCGCVKSSQDVIYKDVNISIVKINDSVFSIIPRTSTYLRHGIQVINVKHLRKEVYHEKIID